MTRLIYAVLVGLVGAGVVHIAVLFLLPYMSDRDAWSRMAELGDIFEPVSIDNGPDARLTSSADPLFFGVACRFEIADGPVRISSAERVLFWSMSVHDREGQNIFSLNDRTASDGTLDIVVLKPVQMLELRNAFPADFERSIFVEADIDAGIVVIRSFLPDATWQPRIAAYLESISCEPY